MLPRMVASRRVAGATVFALQDGAGPFFQPRQQAFPDAAAHHWQQADALDPDAVDGTGGWWLRFRCFAVRLDSGRTVLVDAGIGPAGSPAARWTPVPGRLPEELAAAGIGPDTVDTVVLTHLHTDHVGWAVTHARPYFRNARYVLQQAEFDALAAAEPSVRERVIRPLQDSGQLSLISGDERIAGPLRIVATPGHTPGHQSVLLDTGDGLVAVTGDLLVHAVQLVGPHLRYAFDADPEAARRSRGRVLSDLHARGGLLATAHLGEPFLAATDGGWEPGSRSWRPAEHGQPAAGQPQ